MDTTTTTHRLTTPDGRTLAVDISGPLDGPVVLLLHSAPGSRRFDPDPGVTEGAGVRLVTHDRAGYGDSTPFASDVIPSVAGQAADAALVVESLEVGSVDVVGWSAGGRIAAALAAARPDLVRSLAIVATPAPDREVPWVPEEYRTLTNALRADPTTAVAAMVEALDGMAPAIVADDEVARSQVVGGPADDALLAAHPAVAEAVATMVRAGSGRSVAGLAADIVADQVVDWGFDPAGVTAPTTCWYGSDDLAVTPAHGAWWTEQVTGSRLETVPGAGHLVVVSAWADILASRP